MNYPSLRCAKGVSRAAELDQRIKTVRYTLVKSSLIVDFENSIEIALSIFAKW